MGTNYNFDREFTDFVHNNLAIELIYKKLNWTPQELNKILSQNVDVNNSVDYFFIDNNYNKIITVQERFRESKYYKYNDFTIRFEREFNPCEDRKLSEYYKLNVDYFVYGIINSLKSQKENATDFIKYAVIDVKKLKQLMDEGQIYVDRNYNSRCCKEVNGKLCCPVNYNFDNSSSFIPIDILLLEKLFPNNNIIVLSKGFIN